MDVLWINLTKTCFQTCVGGEEELLKEQDNHELNTNDVDANDNEYDSCLGGSDVGDDNLEDEYDNLRLINNQA